MSALSTREKKQIRERIEYLESELIDVREDFENEQIRANENFDKYERLDEITRALAYSLFEALERLEAYPTHAKYIDATIKEFESIGYIYYNDKTNKWGKK